MVLIVMPLLPESVHSASHAGWEDGNEVTTTNHLTGTHSSVTNRSSWSSNRNSHLQTLRPTPRGVQLERKEEEEEEKRKKNNHRLLTLNAEFTANDDDKEKSLFLSPADSSTRDPDRIHGVGGKVGYVAVCDCDCVGARGALSAPDGD